MPKIEFKLNGETRNANVEPNDMLLDVLRDSLGIKSPKVGCDRGDCGSCTILMNEKSVRSCLIFAIEADGQEILTLEGLSKDNLTPLQNSFVKNNSFQCGYCAPGTILSVTELLDKNSHPNKEEVQEAISGNLCRCTGYYSIIDAVLQLTKEDKK